mgnify:CR=1 FL=1
MKKFQIIVDSASDLDSKYVKNKDIGFRVVPLTITIGDKNYVDDDNINVDEMLESLHKFKGKTSTACPSPEAFSKYYTDTENTFVVTISSKLSGTYNAACLGAKEFENNSHFKIHVIDSKLVSGAEELIVDKLVELIEKGLEFNDIVTEIDKFRDERQLFFTLAKFDNLIANGRMSKIVALIAKTLIIRPVCKGVEGEIKVIEKVIGVNNAFKKMATFISKAVQTFKDKVLIINKCKADNECEQLVKLIKENCDFKEIRIKETKGLCSFYALEKGLIVSL